MTNPASADAKTDFYFRHRAVIEEWAALRATARAEFNLGLRSSLSVFEPTDVSEGVISIDESGPWSKVGLADPEWGQRGWPLAIVLGWNTGQVLDPMGHGLPWVGLFVADSPDRAARSKQIASALGIPARALGWTAPREDGYPLWRHVEQPTGSDTMEAWLRDCRQALKEGWASMAPAVTDFCRSNERKPEALSDSVESE